MSGTSAAASASALARDRDRDRDRGRDQATPLFPPTPSALPAHLDPARRRAHTVSVTMPWRRGYAHAHAYAALRDDDVDVEAGLGPGPGQERSGSASGRARSGSQRSSRSQHSDHNSDGDVADHRGELHDDVVGLLDCVDPEVGTVNHLQNVTNAIVFPPIPGLYSRRPTVCLSNDEDDATVPTLASQPRPPAPARRARRGRHRAESAPVPAPAPAPALVAQVSKSSSSDDDADLDGAVDGDADGDDGEGRTSTEEAGIAKVALDAEDKLRAHVAADMTHELDAHMRRVLLRRRRKDKVRSALRGLGAYLRTPMGIATAIYGFLVAFWGAAIVLFLLGWIPTSSKHAQDVWVEISSQVTNGLFTLTGVGLIPWRAVDTYRMSRIWTLRSRVRRRRARLGLPPVRDWNDLPDPATVPGYVNVLSDGEQAELEHQQAAFAASQTWYRPHASATHTAFPMAWALWNTILMDANSFFQCLLCGCMWGMDYHERPPWTTGTLIPLSFLCGIGAAVLIWQGGVRTKKTAEVQGKLSAALGVDIDVGDGDGTQATQARGRRRAATVGTERPSLHALRAAPGPEAGARAPVRRATVDAAPGAVAVSHLAPLAETAEGDEDGDSPTKEKAEIEMDALALPELPALSAIELPGLPGKRASA